MDVRSHQGPDIITAATRTKRRIGPGRKPTEFIQFGPVQRIEIDPDTGGGPGEVVAAGAALGLTPAVKAEEPRQYGATYRIQNHACCLS